jgi:alkylation response protein AidB-like acyl-CoA dehydrogenase
MSITTSELIQRARDLAPILAQHASEAERERKPANAVIEAMREARIFDLMVPRIYGGLEFDLPGLGSTSSPPLAAPFLVRQLG